MNFDKKIKDSSKKLLDNNPQFASFINDCTSSMDNVTVRLREKTKATNRRINQRLSKSSTHLELSKIYEISSDSSATSSTTSINKCGIESVNTLGSSFETPKFNIQESIESRYSINSSLSVDSQSSSTSIKIPKSR